MEGSDHTHELSHWGQSANIDHREMASIVASVFTLRQIHGVAITVNKLFTCNIGDQASLDELKGYFLFQIMRLFNQ